MNRKRIVNWIVVVAFLFCVAYFLIPIPIEKELSAVFYRPSDDAYFEETTIKINGYLQQMPFFKKKFSGQMTVDNIAFTKQENAKVEFMIDYKSKTDGITIVYSILDNATGEYRTIPFGLLKMKGNFKQMKILVSEPTEEMQEKYTRDLFLVTPAQTKKEAQHISDVFPKTNDLF